MTKIQWGANDNLLEGWTNFRSERDGDITKPLPFPDNSVDFAFTEHCVEHVTPAEGYRFFCECHRILKPGGVVRIIVPDICKVWRLIDDRYKALLKASFKDWWPAIGRPAPPADYEPTDRDGVEHLIFCHGHKAVYNEELLSTLMEVAGFDVEPCEYGFSRHPELNGIDSHWKYVGTENCVLESVVVEGTKPS